MEDVRCLKQHLESTRASVHASQDFRLHRCRTCLLAEGLSRMRRGWRDSEQSFSVVLCQGKERECTPHLFNVFLMFLAERLFFDMLSLPTGANAAQVSWLASCRLAHMHVPSFLHSLVYLCHLPGLLRYLYTHTNTQEVSTK